tara:strand:+ start:716 stop:1318 length:603 start_codon:yes stop_codon:yes gene_type:complete
MKYFQIVIFMIMVSITSVKADEATDWLGVEIDNILNAYKNLNLSDEERFNLIETTINKNFAGAGIAKFVAGKSWGSANKDTKREYVKIFKRHLALNIASMMQGYSDQEYKFVNSIFDKKNGINLIDMEISNNTSKLLVTWRLKKSKERYYVIDLLVADISLIVTKRSEFNSMIKKVDNSLNKFIDVLKKQNKISYSKLID